MWVYISANKIYALYLLARDKLALNNRKSCWLFKEVPIIDLQSKPMDRLLYDRDLLFES